MSSNKETRQALFLTQSQVYAGFTLIEILLTLSITAAIMLTTAHIVNSLSATTTPPQSTAPAHWTQRLRTIILYAEFSSLTPSTLTMTIGQTAWNNNTLANPRGTQSIEWTFINSGVRKGNLAETHYDAKGDEVYKELIPFSMQEGVLTFDKGGFSHAYTNNTEARNGLWLYLEKTDRTKQWHFLQ